MKRLTVLAVLTLLSVGPALAQAPQDLGNASTPGATFATGIVVSSSNDQLVIRDDAGQTMTVFLVDATVGAQNRTAGSRVKVNYHVEKGRAIADEILGYQGEAEPMVTTPPVVVTTPPVVVTTPPTAMVPKPVPAPAPEVVTPTPTYETPAYDAPTSRTALPATASNLGLMGLIGLLALGAAIVIRVAR